SGTGPVPHLGKKAQAFYEGGTRRHSMPTLQKSISQMPIRPGEAHPVSKLEIMSHTLPQKHPCPLKIASAACHVSQTLECEGNASFVADLSTQRQALFIQRLRLRLLASMLSFLRQPTDRNGDTLLVPQFLKERQSLLDSTQ